MDDTPVQPPTDDKQDIGQSIDQSMPQDIMGDAIPQSSSTPIPDIPDTLPPQESIPVETIVPISQPESQNNFAAPAMATESPSIPPPIIPATGNSGEVLLGANPPGEASPKSSSKIAIVVAGILVVAILIIGGLFLFQSMGKKEEKVPVVEKEIKPTPTVIANSFVLTLESPLEGTASAIAEISVAGKTSPNTVVAFFTDTDENSLESDPLGNFAGKIKLASGINKLNVFAVSQSGKEESLARTVTYNASSTATSSASTKKLVHGTLTGINEGVLTILQDQEAEKFSTIIASESAVVKLAGNQGGSLSSLVLGMRVVAIGIEDEDGNILARLFHILKSAP